MADFLEFSGMEAEISRLITDLNRAVGEVDEGTANAAHSAAEIIKAEQQRLFAKTNFKRNKRNHRYNYANGGLIKIKRDEKTRGKVYKLRIGYDSETLKRFPELIYIEFGRPGKSRKHISPVDKNGRKKGKFPASAHVSHIRGGFYLAKDKAVEAFNEALFAIVQRNFRG